MKRKNPNILLGFFLDLLFRSDFLSDLSTSCCSAFFIVVVSLQTSCLSMIDYSLEEHWRIADKFCATCRLKRTGLWSNHQTLTY